MHPEPNPQRPADSGLGFRARSRRLRRLRATRHRLILYGVLAAIFLAGALVGTGSSQENPSTAPVEQQSPAAETGSNTPKDLAEEEATEQVLETFVPTEEVPADSAVSFPVDI